MSNPLPAADRRALLMNALQALDETQARLDAVERARTEPIAIVGMSCRFPGGADSPEAYWELLRNGVDAVSELPEARLALSGETAGPPERPVLQGGFLEGIDGFDPQFFGMSPREAASLDPQQRLVLEVSWEALERAGIAPDRLAGSATGVFLGISTNDYGRLLTRNVAGLDVYAATGGALNAAPGRVAYTLGLSGPALAVDTACSSSLVAVHLAAQSLRTRECELAIAGGVNIALLADAFYCFTEWGMLAANGRCKAFDAAADGFVRGEGCGMVVLKRLSDAQATGDAILAVIRGSAVNQDGRSAGLTVPNGAAQRAVIQSALRSAQLAPARIQYVEAHGTGTSLGDPIEVEAIGAALGPGRDADAALYLGSVKTNLGHLESAAGMAGMIKIILMFQHGQIPPHLHLNERNPNIPWPNFPVLIPTELSPWPESDGPRLAGVSGFGLSGTNAHVILEQAPTPAVDEPQYTRPRHALPLSARDANALRELAGRYAVKLQAQPAPALADVAAGASQGRAQLAHRLALHAGSSAEAAEQLAAFAAEQPAVGVVSGQAPLGGRARPVFLFTGQGSQYAGMGRRLYDSEPTFRAALDRCAVLLEAHLDQPLLDLIFAEPDSPPAALLNETTYTQPALFAIEYALAELWQSWGVRPAAVVGHSLGEYVAACVAGVLSLEDALRLVAARGRLMGSLPAGGVMAAVFASEEYVQAALKPYGHALSVAAVNGPQHTVISGEAEAVGAVSEAFAADGVRVRPLTVSHAFHSALMDPILDEFEALARSAEFRAPQIPLVSNVTSKPWDAGEAPNAVYWRKHLRAPVQFGAAITTLHDEGYDLFIEIGPHPVLSGMGQECVPAGAGAWLPSLRRGQDDWETIFGSLGRYYVSGGNVDWHGVTAPYAAHPVELPTYPFQRQRYWTKAAAYQPAGNDPGQHPLLGRRIRSSLVRSTLFETRVSETRPTYLDDHRIFGTAIFPGSAFIEMALAAAVDSGAVACSIEQLELQSPLVLPHDGAERLLQMAFTPDERGAFSFQIASVTPDSNDLDDAVTHAAGVVRELTPAVLPSADDPASLADSLPETIAIDAYYERLAAAGLDYGPTFRGLTSLKRGEGVAVGYIVLPDGADDGASYQIHPAQLDACFHVVGGAVPDSIQQDDAPYVPVEVNGLRLYQQAPAELWCVAELVETNALPSGSLAARLRLFDAAGQPVAELDRLVIRRAPQSAWSRAINAVPRDWFYREVWRPTPTVTENPQTEPGAWLIVADGSELGSELAATLTARGETTITVSAGGPNSLDLFDPAAPRRLLDELCSELPLRGVLYLGGLGAGGDPLAGATLPGALHLAQALSAITLAPPRLWLITSGAVAVDGEPTPVDAPSAALWGFGRTLAAEQPALQCTCLDLDPTLRADAVRIAELVTTADAEHLIALRGGQRYVARLERQTQLTSALPSGPYRLLLPERGTLDRLRIVPLERREPGPGEIEVAVRATGLNFRDVLNVLGMYPGDPGPPGVECAGIVTAVGAGVEHLRPGDEVVALGIGHFASHVLVQAHLAFPKPAGLSFVEAAAVPSAYLAAAYGLLHLANLQPGERVLIHAATGGVGLAAVYIAMSRGAEVFATVGSPAKRAFLANLGVRNIFSSRRLDFADEVLAATGGAGVDVILNSLADDFIDRSFAVLKPTGRFLELGKRGVWSPARVAEVRPAAAYHVYDLGEVLQTQPGVLENLLRELLGELATGRMPLTPVRAFPAASTVDAFRYMAQARHIGKVVVVQRPEESRGVRADGSYLITGGMGGLGLETARWLVAQGAEAVALIGRSAPSATAREQIAELEQAGARILVLQGDVSCEQAVAAALAQLDHELPPLRGVFHAAGTIDDGGLEQQSRQRIESVLAPKAGGALHLDRLTRRYDLDHFVLYSSASAVLGSPGQIGYTAANAVLDALAHARQTEGLPALSINWGAWETIGMAAGLGEAHRRRLSERGMGTIPTERGFAALGMALGLDVPQLVIMPARWDVIARQFDAQQASPLIRDLLNAVKSTRVESKVSIAEQLARAPQDEHPGLIHGYLLEAVAGVLGLPVGQIDAHQPLIELGLDSLMAVEVRNGVASALQIALSPADILDGASAGVLAERVLALVSEKAVDGAEPVLGSPDAEAVAAAALLANLDQLSDRQVEELINLIGAGGSTR